MKKYLVFTLMTLIPFVVACGAPPTPTPAPTPDPTALFRQLMDADNRGDIAAAVAFFTDDAVISGLGSCQQKPCAGKDAIQKEEERGLADHTQHVRVDLQASGSTVNARIEHQNDASRAAGIDRFVVLSTVNFQGNKIASVQRKLDITDSQTATFLKFQQAQAPKP